MLVALAAAIGNLLQGWDNSAMAGNIHLKSNVHVCLIIIIFHDLLLINLILILSLSIYIYLHGSIVLRYFS